MDTTRNPFEGCMLGLAIGDALGYPTEFIRRQQILARHGPAGVTGFVPSHSHPAGTYTDDTQMTIAVAEGLLAAASRELDPQMRAIAERFVAWSHAPENDRAPGNTCLAGCANLERGVHWREAGVAGSKGCGSAMRVAPVGLLYHADLDRLVEAARASSQLTHGHPAALEGAAAAALMVALALRGASPEEMFEAIQERCFGRASDFDACLQRVPQVLDLPPGEALTADVLGESWVADEAVASALYCVWRHPDDFSAGVLEAINTDGDSDSIGAITGSVLGARLGLDGIPADWARDVEDATRLLALAGQLWEATQ